tara:strand:- start:239 stop:454 length:216 start_codon:yes stop_codon:yes gene_type:complete
MTLKLEFWRTNPPTIPPTKVPKNWKVEKKPIDAPLDDVGAILEIDDGKDASRTLNDPIKNTRKKIVYIALL